MKNFLTVLDKPIDTRKLARRLSKENGLHWYFMESTKRPSVAVSELDVDRYIKLGFKIVCCFYNGHECHSTR
jgi:hypothetical protein